MTRSTVQIAKDAGATDEALNKAASIRFVFEHLDILTDAFVALKARVAGIEKKGVEYLGVWQAAASYQRGNLVTHGGSIWHANEDTRAKPGDGKTWTLACKGGSR